jgi:hypothetical protein
MNKRIRKKHTPRFNLRLLGFSFYELEKALGHGIDHKIKRSLTNRRLRKYRREPKNTKMIELTTNMFEKMWMASIEQSFYQMDYFENKSQEV